MVWVCFSLSKQAKVYRIIRAGLLSRLIFSLICSLFKKQWESIHLDRSSQHKRGANLLLKVVQCVKTQKCSNCSTLDLFGIHQQMLTGGTCGHYSSCIEMFLFALSVFEIGSVLLRQRMLLFSVCVSHVDSLRSICISYFITLRFVVNISLCDKLFLPAEHSVLRNLSTNKKEVSPAVCNLLFSW